MREDSLTTFLRLCKLQSCIIIIFENVIRFSMNICVTSYEL